MSSCFVHVARHRCLWCTCSWGHESSCNILCKMKHMLGLDKSSCATACAEKQKHAPHLEMGFGIEYLWDACETLWKWRVFVECRQHSCLLCFALTCFQQMFFKLPGAPFIVKNDLYVKPTVQLRRMTGWRLNDLWCVFPAIGCNIEVLKHPHNRIKWFSRKHKRCERLVVPCSSHFISFSHIYNCCLEIV